MELDRHLSGFLQEKINRLIRQGWLGIGLIFFFGLVFFAARPGQTLASLQSYPTIAGCPQFPYDNVWNVRVDGLSVDPHSTDYITSIGANTGLHPDFGQGLYENQPMGIPYNIVPGSQAGVTVVFKYSGESDPGLYPIPPNPLIEGGPNSSSTSDRHILIVDKDYCKLYEIYNANPQIDGTWKAGSGAIYDLNSNALRPDTWTSADAAGLPILPGLVRYDEVASGAILHALRFTANNTRDEHIWPARHDASSLTDQTYPPMGQRFRLKASFDISPYPDDVKVILTALKTYGMILADNGSDWYISGEPNENWNNDTLHRLGEITGNYFEAVDEFRLIVNPDSGQAIPPSGKNFIFFPLLTRN
jgi:hypothetical protein